MPDFEIAKSDRFIGDFAFVPAAGYTASPKEQAYVNRLQILLGRLASADMTSPDLKDDLEAARSKCANYLLGRVRKFTAEAAGADRDGIADRDIEASHRAEGIYLDRCSLITTIPFVVDTVPPESGIPARITDIEIKTRDVPISEEKKRFKVDVDRTITVFKTVLGERRSWRWFRKGVADPKAEEAQRRLDEYLRALGGLARVGLMNLDKTQIGFARLALEGLQNEFVSREAGIVKNTYVTRLGMVSLVAVALGAVGYLLSTAMPNDWIPFRFREFFLLGCGSAVGTWLSFSIRRVQLSFDDLALLEEDRLNPSLRIVFMISLTTVVGLLLWTKGVVFEIGGLKSTFAHNGAYAVLIGALCGIAERAMTTAVSRRAQDFATSLGSITKS